MKCLRIRCLFWVIGACFLAGCSDRGDRPEIGTVTGTVYMDDQPLPNVWVMFSPTSGRTSIGRTNEQGQYELNYLERVKGAKIGSHSVAIMTYNEDEIEEMKLEAKGPIKDPIPDKYNAKTTLTAEVKKGKNVIDFHLESE